jgi:hypothetical protein
LGGQDIGEKNLISLIGRALPTHEFPFIYRLEHNTFDKLVLKTWNARRGKVRRGEANEATTENTSNTIVTPPL